MHPGGVVRGALLRTLNSGLKTGWSILKIMQPITKKRQRTAALQDASELAKLLDCASPLALCLAAPVFVRML
jgi:hypothetical protein